MITFFGQSLYISDILNNSNNNGDEMTRFIIVSVRIYSVCTKVDMFSVCLFSYFYHIVSVTWSIVQSDDDNRRHDYIICVQNGFQFVRLVMSVWFC